MAKKYTYVLDGCTYVSQGEFTAWNIDAAVGRAMGAKMATLDPDHDLKQAVFETKSPRLMAIWASDLINGRWPEAEPFIMTDAHWAAYYADHCIKGRWPEAEPAIATNGDIAWRYFRARPKERFILGEQAILSIPGYAHTYMVIFPEVRKLALAMGWIKPIEL